MNKDLEQIKRFVGLKGTKSGNSLTGWFQDDSGLSPESAYIKITSYGKKGGKVNDLQKLNLLFNAKKSRDLHKQMWTEDLRNGLLSVQELVDDGEEDIAWDCMKDIIKTTSRLTEIERINKETPWIKNKEGNYFSICLVIMGNRNWFIDKLNIKFPEDSCDCYTCKEEFWKHGCYVRKNDRKSFIIA